MGVQGQALSGIASWCTSWLPHQSFGPTPTLPSSPPHPPSSSTSCRYEEDAAALRALRMVLRDLTYKLLGNKKWEWFWEPEEDPEWWDKVRGWLESKEEVGHPKREAGGLEGLLGPDLAKTGGRLGGLSWASTGLALDLPPTTTQASSVKASHFLSASICASTQVTHPMDLATVLANVNARVYATPQQYLADIGRIVQVGFWVGPTRPAVCAWAEAPGLGLAVISRRPGKYRLLALAYVDGFCTWPSC